MTDSDDKQRGLDATLENEGSRDLSPMVQISIKEYDQLKYEPLVFLEYQQKEHKS